VRFEWDPEKAKQNLKKHRVSFNEGMTIFFDPLSITFNDPDHSRHEARYITFGFSTQGRLLVVSHANKGELIRIINVRKPTPLERKKHEK
jgi:uncharacterized protein